MAEGIPAPGKAELDRAGWCALAHLSPEVLATIGPRTATVVVAAADSLNKEAADYICPGVDDQDMINPLIDDDLDILLMNGKYNISGYILAEGKSNFTLRGQGTATIIEDTTYLTQLVYIHNCSHARLTNMKFHKVHDTVGDNGTGVSIIHSPNTTIDNTWLEGTVIAASPWDATPTWGIRCQYSPGTVYYRNFVRYTCYEALTLWEGCTGCVFAANVVEDCGFGLVFEKEGTYGNTMIGNTIKASHKGGQADILIRSTHSNVVDGNTIFERDDTNIVGEGIRVDGLSYNNTISNNILYNAGGIAILERSSNNTIVGNTISRVLLYHGVYTTGNHANIIKNNSITFCESHGVMVDNAPHTEVVNNIIKNCTEYGIRVRNDSKECIIKGNTLIGNDPAGILFYPTAGDSIADAICYDNIIYDPYGDISNTLNAAATAGDATIEVSNIGNISLGQRIRIEAGGNQDDTRVVNIHSDADNGIPAIISIDPALSNDHANDIAITGIQKQTVGLQAAGAGTLSPIHTRNNVLRNVSIPIILPTNFVCRNNIGFVTENSGTDTVGAAAQTKDVTHGLAVTPAAGDITIVPIGDWGAATKYWISAYSSTTFTVTVDQAPGAPTFQFAWKAIVL